MLVRPWGVEVITRLRGVMRSARLKIIGIVSGMSCISPCTPPSLLPERFHPRPTARRGAGAPTLWRRPGLGPRPGSIALGDAHLQVQKAVEADGEAGTVG